MITQHKMRKVFGKEVDTVSKRKGIYTIRKAFFGNSPDNYTHYDLRDLVLRYYPLAIILESGIQCKPYKMKARLSAQSHWFVKFKFD